MDEIKIDSHQHFWKYHPNTHGWIDSSMETIKKDFLPTDLQPLLKKNGISGCIAVQAQQSEEETLFLLHLADKYDFIKGVVGWLDLCAADIDEKLQKYSKYPKLVGLRHVVQDEPDANFMLRPDFKKGISLLQKQGLTYDILIYPKQLPAALELVKLFPEQPFVIDHIAKPKIDGTMDKVWGSYISELGKCENVYCKISGMVTETAWGSWSKNDFVPYLDKVFASFGPEKIMFGSDWPVCLLSAQYGEVIEIIESYLTHVQKDVREKIMGLNSLKYYGVHL